MQLTRCFFSRDARLSFLFAFALALLGQPGSVLAGKYGPQAFTYANGTVPGSGGWNDGVVLSSPLVGDPLAPMASVRSNMLRMTIDGVSNAVSSLKIPDLDQGQEISSFTVTFLLSMTAAGTPGNGFSVNFGDIPEGDGDGELGYALGDGLVVGFRTLVDAANGEISGEIAVYANRVKLAAFPQAFLYDGMKTNVSINWDAQGLDLIYAGATLADNLPVPGVVPHVGDRFAISARTGDSASQEISLDSLQVTTKPVGNILTGGFIISEFVANNQDSMQDDDLESSDWIEIYNGGTNSNLNGWYLTNVKTNPTLWAFPSVALASNQFRLVFASGKDRRATNAQLHASFTLQREGGYLALVRPDLTIASEYTYGAQKQDVAYGEVGASRERGYLETPTPGKKNISAVADGPPAEDVTYSREGGLLAGAAPLSLSILTPAALNAEVRYTRDNTVPTALSRLYASPFAITNTTTLRARVFVPGRLPGKVSSQTFLKLDASLVNFAGTGQPFSSSLPVLVFDSFGVPVDATTDPGGARPFRLNYGVVINTDPQTGRSSLTNTADFQGRGGMHVRGESSSGFGQKSYAWEIWNNNNQDEDASILGLPAESDWALHGPWSDLTMMRNYLVFSSMADVQSHYAGSRTRFVEVFFNQEVGQPVSYTDYKGVYLLVEKIKRSKNRVSIAKMNSLVTDPALITGGYIYKTDKASPGSTPWTTSRGISMQSHDPEAFSGAQTKYLKDYVDNFEKALYGPDPSNPVTGYASWIDVPAFIDSQWWIELAKQVDAYVFSTYYHKDRGGKMRTGPLWDFNIALGNANYATGDTPTGWLYANSATEPLAGGLWYSKLQADPEYRLKHWDRYWEIRQGVWSTDSMFARIDAVTALFLDGNSILISNNMPATVQSPAARQFRKHPILAAGQWPNPAGFANRRTFQSELDYMKKWLSDRLLWIDDQNLGGISILRPPLLSQSGGLVQAGYPLTLASYSGTPPPGKRYPEGTIYYTTDGSDPRPPAYGVPVSRELVLVPAYQQATYFVPTIDNGGPGVAFADWTAPALGPTASSLTWTAGRLGLGFDDSASTNYFHVGGGDYAQGDIRAAMQGKSSTVFIRVPFTLSPAQVQQVTALKLKMRSDDGYVAYLNGVLVGRFNIKATNNPAWDTVANNLPASWPDSEAVKLRDFALTNAVTALRPGENVLAILGVNASVNDDDALFSPLLSATILEPPGTVIASQSYSAPIPIQQTTTVKARLFSGGFWSPISTATFVVGAVPASAQNLVISEIMYHPAPPTAAEAKISASVSDYEFLEFLNTSAVAIDMSQVRLTNGVFFNFSNGDPAALVLPAGGRVVICANLAAFQVRYGTNNPAIRIAGVFGDNLGNGGETLTLVGRNGEVLWSFAYKDKEPWPVDADGAGYSIVLNQPTSHPAPDPALGANWRSSAVKNGAPGQPDGTAFTLEPLGDLDGDGLPNFLEHAIGADPAVPSSAKVITASLRSYTVSGEIGQYVSIEFHRNLRAADVIYELQTSSNLTNWKSQSGDVVYVGTRNNGDGTATVTWRTALAMDQEPKPFLFVRLLVK